MCGIAGWIGPVERREAVRRMHEEMRHRGPDGDGLWFSDDGTVGLAHRRLAILAPSPLAGQPMASGGCRIVFNGEIYNHEVLRADMVRCGMRFEIPGSDTEVLLRLCAEEGSAGLAKLHGMFSFAFHDEAAGTILLARDPFGIKPLYYAETSGGLVFASELRTILASGLVERRINPLAAAGFFQTGSVPGPLTLVEGVREFPPGHFAVWSPGRTLEIRPFLAPTFEGVRSDADPSALVASAMQESVRAHMVSDVPVGVFLSGGIDSGIVAALAAERGPLTAYSLIFAQRKFSEESRIRETARMHGIALEELRLDEPTAREWLGGFFEALDQPSVDGFNTYCVSRWAASLGAKVVLSGLGGDELFGGYPSFSTVPRWRERGRVAEKSGSAGALAGVLLDSPRCSPRLRRAASWLEDPAGWHPAYALARGVFSHGETRSILRHFGIVPAEFRDRGILPDIGDGREMVSLLEATRYMRNQLLRDSDVMSMAHGLELRVPFVDVPLWGRMATLDPSARFAPGKSLLARALPVLPESVRLAKKQGFTLPVEEWRSLTGSAADFPSDVIPGTWARRMAVAVFRDWTERHGIETGDAQARTRRRSLRPVLLMAPTVGNERGGIQEFTREIVRALKSGDGLSHVVALSYNGTTPGEDGFVEWADCGKSVSRVTAFLFQALRLCLKWRPRVIFSTFPGFAPVGVACGKIFGIPFATVAHGIEVWRGMSPQKRAALRAADRVLAVSRFTAEKLVQASGVTPGRIGIFPNTVDSENFFRGPASSGLADRMEIPAGVPVLLTVARLDIGERYKGVERVWDAMQARAEGPLAQAVHVVAGSGSDLERLRAEALRRGLGQRVRFTGPVSGAELSDIYRMATVFVMPSTKEGFGIVFLEAMSSGIPVVASDAGGSPDALLGGRLGWLADPGSTESLASCIEEALGGDPGDPRRDPEFLRSSVASHFGRNSFRARLEAELRDLAG
jgi:asparagine synthase (glutamine-hydrolysing)